LIAFAFADSSPEDGLSGFADVPAEAEGLFCVFFPSDAVDLAGLAKKLEIFPFRSAIGFRKSDDWFPTFPTSFGTM
jgi:hypothetical protein